MNVLAIDIGGSHVKLACSGAVESRQFDSSSSLTPGEMIRRVQQMTGDWECDVVSLGIPAMVGRTGVMREPPNLGTGWCDFDFAGALGKPVRVVNDAAMQALGAYDGGRMLFIGLGTGLGSTLIAERVVIPMELGALHNLDAGDRTPYGIRLGKQSMETLGEAGWKKLAIDAICMFKETFYADYVVIGGGHASLIDPLPDGVRRGGNDDAFTGGFRLWEKNVEPHDALPSSAFRVVR